MLAYIEYTKSINGDADMKKKNLTGLIIKIILNRGKGRDCMFVAATNRPSW